ncbi:hypothetical protein ACFL4G_01715 [Thermodesulfobacteriota bacterium]
MFLWIIILCGGALLWHLFRKTKGLDEDLSSALDSVYRQRSELIERIDGLRKELLELRVDVKRGSGDLRITKDITIAEALMIDARVKDVLEEFNIGGCSTCSLSDQETLEEAAASYGLNVEEMTAAIERAIGDFETSDFEPAEDRDHAAELEDEGSVGGPEEREAEIEGMESEPLPVDSPAGAIEEEPEAPVQNPPLEIVEEEPEAPALNPSLEIVEEEPVTTPEDPDPTRN